MASEKKIVDGIIRGWIGAIVAACIAVPAQASTFYWDGPDAKAWNAVDNGGLTWWRTGATNGAYSAALPGDDDVCYDLKTTLLSPTVDLGTSGHYAVIHLGNGARVGAYSVPGNNPLVVDSGNAVIGAAAGSQTWYGSITVSNGATLTLAKDESYRELRLYSPISGGGAIICSNNGPALLVNFLSSYSGGTVIPSGRSLNLFNENYTSGGSQESDGSFGTGPVDMGNGAVVNHGNWPVHSRFVNNRSSFYGCAGGTNYITTGTDWEITGSNVTWRPGPRDRSGVGVTGASGMPNLKAVGSGVIGYPTLQIGMKLGGLCDRLVMATNSTVRPNLRLNSQIRLTPDNIEAKPVGGPWTLQSAQKYVVVELTGSTSDHAVYGTFANEHQAVSGQSYQRIVFTNNFFKSAYITYQGDAGTGSFTGGNDILIWNVLPVFTGLGTVVTLR